jgi:hypothetical protein
LRRTFFHVNAGMDWTRNAVPVKFRLAINVRSG